MRHRTWMRNVRCAAKSAWVVGVPASSIRDKVLGGAVARRSLPPITSCQIPAAFSISGRSSCVLLLVLPPTAVARNTVKAGQNTS